MNHRGTESRFDGVEHDPGPARDRREHFISVNGASALHPISVRLNEIENNLRACHEMLDRLLPDASASDLRQETVVGGRLVGLSAQLRRRLEELSGYLTDI
jgi:hypothetical protein